MAHIDAVVQDLVAVDKADLREYLANREIAVPEDYGAVGDNITDDTDAINDALAAESFVKFPRIYRALDTVVVPENTMVLAEHPLAGLRRHAGASLTTPLLRLYGTHSTWLGGSIQSLKNSPDGVVLIGHTDQTDAANDYTAGNSRLEDVRIWGVNASGNKGVVAYNAEVTHGTAHCSNYLNRLKDLWFSSFDTAIFLAEVVNETVLDDLHFEDIELLCVWVRGVLESHIGTSTIHTCGAGVTAVYLGNKTIGSQTHNSDRNHIGAILCEPGVTMTNGVVGESNCVGNYGRVSINATVSGAKVAMANEDNDIREYATNPILYSMPLQVRKFNAAGTPGVAPVFADFIVAQEVGSALDTGSGVSVIVGESGLGAFNIGTPGRPGCAVIQSGGPLSGYNGLLQFLLHNGTSLAARLELTAAGILQPIGNGTQDLGASSRRYKDIYASNATIQTSDINVKENVKDLDPTVAARLVQAIRPVSFQFVDDNIPAERTVRSVARPKVRRSERPVTGLRMRDDGKAVTVPLERPQWQDGRWVMAPVIEVTEEPVLEMQPVYDAAGRPVLDATGKQLQQPMPVMEEHEVVVEQPAYQKANVRTHHGFLAQQIVEALKGEGLTTQDFAAVVIDRETGLHGLRDAEMLPLLWRVVQALIARVEALEARRS